MPHVLPNWMLHIFLVHRPSNEFADALSRWDTISLPPYGFSPADRCEFSLHALWFPKSEITVHPPNVSLSWPLPG